MRSSTHVWGAALLAGATLAAVGGAAAVVWFEPGAPEGLVHAALPTTAPTVAVQYFDEHEVVAVIQRAAPFEVRSPRGGRVTALGACAAGSTVVSGDRLLDLDERPLVALHTSVPLWRDLGAGMRGEDVRAVQEEMQRLGYDLTADGVFGRSTSTALRDVWRKAGLDLPRHRAPTLADVLWIPASAVPDQECAVALGDAVDEDDVLVEIIGGVHAITVAEVPLSRLPGPRVLDLGVVQVATDDGGVVRDPELLAEVGRLPELRLAPEDDGDGGISTDAVWALVDPLQATGVPPRSLAAVEDGRGCVSSAGVAYTVDVVSSSLGTTLVTFVDEVGPPDMVDLDPRGGPCG